jgi:cysteine desulfurase
MVALDLNGMGVSRGSACASGAQKPSHVLKAMNIEDEVINNHLRFSFGWNIKTGDGTKSAEIVTNTIKEII